MAQEAKPRVVTRLGQAATIHVAGTASSAQTWSDGYILSLTPVKQDGTWLDLNCELEIRDQGQTSTARFNTRVPVGEAYTCSFGSERGPVYGLEFTVQLQD